MRIRKRSQSIPSRAIIFDLDGTIIDHRATYAAEAERRGYRLTLAQCNYNLIKQYVPVDILREIDALAFGDGTRSATTFPGALDVLREYSTQAYIVAGRTTDEQRSALGWLSANLPVFTSDHVIFFPTTAAKAKALASFDPALVVDDQLAPLKALPETTMRILFDPDQALSESAVQSIRVARSWDQVREALRSTVKPVL